MRIDEFGDALTRGQAAFLVLRVNGLAAAALLNFCVLILDFGNQVSP